MTARLGQGAHVSTWIVLLVAIALVAWGVFAFNRLVALRNQVRNAWADIDVQLARRHDLVPQLVTAVKAYADHEQAVLTAATALRDQAVAQSGPRRICEAETALENALVQVFALQEAYPALKASGNFLSLQQSLVEIEDHLQYARRFYNGAVRDLNDAIQRVPDVLVARSTGFREAEFYQAADDARTAMRITT